MFRVLNMRSVPAATGSDVTARARIRDAAIRRFAGEGFGAPVRAIAADAGVSPGLVIHHFGSKEALRAVCDEHVLRAIRAAKAQTIAGPPGDMLVQLAGLDEYAPLAGYLVQALLAGGELASHFLDRLTEDAEAYIEEGVAAGRVRPSRDPAARARFLARAGVGGLLVYLRQHPPAGGDFRATLRAYTEEVALPALELYTEGLFADSGLLDAYLAAGRAPVGPAQSPS
jgi:AcrR family transcriptional regulator